MKPKKVNTKILSARVTHDVYSAWQTLAASKDLSVSECIRDAVTMIDKTAILKSEDGILVPNEITSVVGTRLYKIIRTVLNQSEMAEEHIESISILLALQGQHFSQLKLYAKKTK